MTHILDKDQSYQELLTVMKALLTEETDWLANLANASALLFQELDDINWVGFYLLKPDGQLILGPFQGKPACTRLPMGKGVCGTAITQNKTQVVADVHKFPGHIACDPLSRSEIVIPLHVNGRIWGVLDVDSPNPGRFNEQDARGLELISTHIAAKL